MVGRGKERVERCFRSLRVLATLVFPLALLTKAGRSTRANYLHNRSLEKYENTRVFSFRDVRTPSKIAERSAFSRATRAQTTLSALCKWSRELVVARTDSEQIIRRFREF